MPKAVLLMSSVVAPMMQSGFQSVSSKGLSRRMGKRCAEPQKDSGEGEKKMGVEETQW